MSTKSSSVLWTHDLSPLERRFLAAMNELDFGYFESVRVKRGALILDPWPTTVRNIRLAAEPSRIEKAETADFELKPAVIEFFNYVRCFDAGEILLIEVRRGLPTSMKVRCLPASA